MNPKPLSKQGGFCWTTVKLYRMSRTCTEMVHASLIKQGHFVTRLPAFFGKCLTVCLLLVHGIALSRWMDELTFGAESLLSCFTGYVWSDKSPVKYTKWNPQQPDSHHGQQPCVEIYSTGDWADTGCYSVKQFICMMPRCKAKHTLLINLFLAGCKENQFSSLPFRQAVTVQ